MEAESFENLFSGQPGSTADGSSSLQKLTRLVMIRPTARPPHTSFRWVFPYFERVPESFHTEQVMQHTQLMPEKTLHFLTLVATSLGQEIHEKFFFSQAVLEPTSLNGGEPEALDVNAMHYLHAVISCILGANNRFLQARRESWKNGQAIKYRLLNRFFRTPKPEFAAETRSR